VEKLAFAIVKRASLLMSDVVVWSTSFEPQCHFIMTL